MPPVIAEHAGLLVPFIFVIGWLVSTVLIGVMAGWFALEKRYPNRPDQQPLLRLRWRSGSMGRGINLNGILHLDVCPQGLRVGILRLFGPFCRPFFMPWDEITVSRTTRWFWPVAQLTLGEPVLGTLILSNQLADQLANAAGSRWPEPTPPPPRMSGTALVSRLVLGWLAMSAFVGAFIIVVSRAMPQGDRIPVLPLILLPAVILAVNAVVIYIRHRR